MRLLLVRHAIAVERGTPGISDSDRALTKEGKKRFRKAAAGIARLMGPPNALLTSPLKRAHETALILARAWGGITPRKTPALAGGNFDELLQAIARYKEASELVLVGHEPHLSAVLGKFLGGVPPERLAFRKGGVALVEFAGSLDQGGVLVFALPPRVLRRLA